MNTQLLVVSLALSPCISVLGLFFETGLYPGPGWPRTHCVAQPGIRLRSSSHLRFLSVVLSGPSPCT